MPRNKYRSWVREFTSVTNIYVPSSEEVNIETIEMCPKCDKNFLSRWGRLHKCSDHKYLEETVGPAKLKKLTNTQLSTP